MHDIELRNCEEIHLGNLSLKEGKNSVGLPVLILEFWQRHVKTKNRYVPPQRVWFSSRFGLKTGIYFDHYGLKSGMVFEGTTGGYKGICLFNAK